MPPRPIQVAAEDHLRRCPGLASIRATLSGFASSKRPALIRGEVSTVRALLPDLVEGTKAVVELECSVVPEAEDGRALLATLQAHNHTLTRRGALVLFEIDRLGPNDREQLEALARASLDGGNTALTARLICQVDPRRQRQPVTFAPGLFLDVEVPPLRQRPDDAAYLVESLLNERLGRRAELDVDANQALLAHSWPSDLPELLTLVERLEARNALGDLPPTLSADDLGLAVVSKNRALARARAAQGRTLRELLAEFEEEVLRTTMQRLRSNKSQAAKELGISRSYLIAKCHEYKID